jgi:hypothetical protein
MHSYGSRVVECLKMVKTFVGGCIPAIGPTTCVSEHCTHISYIQIKKQYRMLQDPRRRRPPTHTAMPGKGADHKKARSQPKRDQVQATLVT